MSMWALGIGLPLLLLLIIVQRKNPKKRSINYSSNPYRVGAYVYVMENTNPSEHDWQGTYIGMSDGYALVRDIETHVVAHVNKDQLYGAQR